jgi:TetR/AcrR family transcriptional regulator, cholesterol catabolism regulator
VPRQSRGPNTYSEMLDVAARVFDRKGYHEATMQDIADAAKLTKGGLYHHLSSKEETLFAINERYLRSGLTEIKLITSKPVPPEERLRELLVAIAAQHDRANPDLRVSLLHFDAVRQPYRKRLIGLRNEYESVVKALLSECISAGVLVDTDVDLLVKFAFGSLNWMCIWYRPRGRYTAREVGEAFADYMLTGLLSDRSRAVTDAGALDEAVG